MKARNRKRVRKGKKPNTKLKRKPSTKDRRLGRIKTRDGILGHYLDKILESFAPCHSQSLLLADFKDNQTLLWFQKYIQKIREARKLESIHEYHFVERVEKLSLRRLQLMHRNLD